MTLSAKTENEIILSFIFDKFKDKETFVSLKQGQFLSAKNRNNLKLKEISLHLATTLNSKLIISYEKNKIKGYIRERGEKDLRISRLEICETLQNEFNYNIVSYQDSDYLKLTSFLIDINSLNSPIKNLIFNGKQINNILLTKTFVEQQILTNNNSNYYKTLTNLIEMNKNSDYKNTKEDIKILFSEIEEEIDSVNTSDFEKAEIFEISI
jgi:hypothetical protein